MERPFEVIGEALSQPFNVGAESAQRITPLPRSVAFRNILIHRDASVDARLVCGGVETRWPNLPGTPTALLEKP